MSAWSEKAWDAWGMTCKGLGNGVARFLGADWSKTASFITALSLGLLAAYTAITFHPLTLPAANQIKADLRMNEAEESNIREVGRLEAESTFWLWLQKRSPKLAKEFEKEIEKRGKGVGK